MSSCYSGFPYQMEFESRATPAHFSTYLLNFTEIGRCLSVPLR